MFCEDSEYEWKNKAFADNIEQFGRKTLRISQRGGMK